MLFLLLYAQFIAAAQIVVYAGAVMVLYVFVAAYVGGVEEPLWEPIPGQRFLAPMLGRRAARGAGDCDPRHRALGDRQRGPTLPGGFGTPSQIGNLLLEHFLVAFEAASMLLLVAAVGAVTLAARSRKRDEPDRARGPA